MPEAISALTHELLLWVARRPRTYAQALDAWRSNCPRQTVWEDAVIEGLVQVVRTSREPSGTSGTSGTSVILTSRGRAALDAAPKPWAILDSNQGPPPYQSGALTN